MNFEFDNIEIDIDQDEEGNLYSNESILKGILHNTRFEA